MYCISGAHPCILPNKVIFAGPDSFPRMALCSGIQSRPLEVACNEVNIPKRLVGFALNIYCSRVALIDSIAWFQHRVCLPKKDRSGRISISYSLGDFNVHSVITSLKIKAIDLLIQYKNSRPHLWPLSLRMICSSILVILHVFLYIESLLSLTFLSRQAQAEKGLDCIYSLWHKSGRWK